MTGENILRKGYKNAQAIRAMTATDKARTGHEMNTMLVIEDNWAVRELFAVELASEGVKIVPTGEVDSIREKIRASNPDLVLLDIYMKGKLRWDVLADIKEENAKLPVIIVNDFEDYSNDPHFILVDEFWIKSACFADLKKKIGEVLQGKRKIFSSPKKEEKDMAKRNKRKEEGLSSGAKKESIHMRKVHFILNAPEANEVYLAGEFNGWHTQTLPMIKGEDGVWNATMELPVGRHEYKLLVDGAWREDRSCEVEVETGPVRAISESKPVINSYGTLNYVLYL